MDKYSNLYREMISLRGLTAHTLKSYSTYIRSYLTIFRIFFTSLPKRFPGRNFVIMLSGFRKNATFLIEPSTAL